jgi:hypothetical protein
MAVNVRFRQLRICRRSRKRLAQPPSSMELCLPSLLIMSDHWDRGFVWGCRIPVFKTENIKYAEPPPLRAYLLLASYRFVAYPHAVSPSEINHGCSCSYHSHRIIFHASRARTLLERYVIAFRHLGICHAEPRTEQGALHPLSYQQNYPSTSLWYHGSIHCVSGGSPDWFPEIQSPDQVDEKAIR